MAHKTYIQWEEWRKCHFADWSMRLYGTHQCTHSTNIYLPQLLRIRSDELMGLCCANSSNFKTSGCSKQENRSNAYTWKLHLWSSFLFNRIQRKDIPVNLLYFKPCSHLATGEVKSQKKADCNMLLQNRGKSIRT